MPVFLHHKNKITSISTPSRKLTFIFIIFDLFHGSLDYNDKSPKVSEAEI